MRAKTAGLLRFIGPIAIAGGLFADEPHQRGDGRRRARIGAAVRDSHERHRMPRRLPGTHRSQASHDAQPWIPHSVLPVPSQRPLRGSAPGSTRAVQVEQPIDG